MSEIIKIKNLDELKKGDSVIANHGSRFEYIGKENGELVFIHLDLYPNPKYLALWNKLNKPKSKLPQRRNPFEIPYRAYFAVYRFKESERDNEGQVDLGDIKYTTCDMDTKEFKKYDEIIKSISVNKLNPAPIGEANKNAN